MRHVGPAVAIEVGGDDGTRAGGRGVVGLRERGRLRGGRERRRGNEHGHDQRAGKRLHKSIPCRGYRPRVSARSGRQRATRRPAGERRTIGVFLKSHARRYVAGARVRRASGKNAQHAAWNCASQPYRPQYGAIFTGDEVTLARSATKTPVLRLEEDAVRRATERGALEVDERLERPCGRGPRHRQDCRHRRQGKPGWRRAARN